MVCLANRSGCGPMLRLTGEIASGRRSYPPHAKRAKRLPWTLTHSNYRSGLPSVITIG